MSAFQAERQRFESAISLPLRDNLFHNSSAVESVTVNHLVPGSNPGCGVSHYKYLKIG